MSASTHRGGVIVKDYTAKKGGIQKRLREKQPALMKNFEKASADQTVQPLAEEATVPLVGEDSSEPWCNRTVGR